MLVDGEEWRRFFDAFEYEAWRFEAQPTYTMPKEQENVARFLRGEKKPADHNARWHERVREYVASGRRVVRVRVVRRPLTDYQRYQFAWGIPGNIGAGEDIRILDVTREDYGLPPDLPDKQVPAHDNSPRQGGVGAVVPGAASRKRERGGVTGDCGP
ncbi:DUF6879 family protein [Streptomyces sp. NPDC054796]